MTNDDVVRAAADAYHAGLCVLPPRQDGTKQPIGASWAQWQTQRPDTETLAHWYANGRVGLGSVCGAISGNLEAFEFDDTGTYRDFKQVAVATGLGELVERIEAGYSEESGGGGVHWLYRCAEIAGSTELARRPGPPDQHGNPTVEMLIETRGEGGYIVLAPSSGTVHPSGHPYRLLQGSFATIAPITPDERRALWDLARSFDEMTRAEAESEGLPLGTATDGTRPGDDFNARATWPEVLEPRGWTLVHRHGPTERWRRPGKDRGVSATINGPGITPDRLYVFSTSTPFASRTSYTKFAAYAVLEHHGDYQAAARELGRRGYGTSGSSGSTTGDRAADGAPSPTDDAADTQDVTLDEFYAYMPSHQYIYVPTGEMWLPASINGRLGTVAVGGVAVKASAWLDRHRPVEQTTWAPGEPTLLLGKLISEGGWFKHPGAVVYNGYKPPTIAHGDPEQVDPWLEHLQLLYPGEAEHILRWFAHRVQRPGEKVNHALVLGGVQGIGKDTILEPLKRAVGPWNFKEVGPTQLLGRFNGFVKSTVLRVSEARDLGDAERTANRYALYEHMKQYTAAPPDVIRVDEKHLREIAVPNVMGVVITTNHRTDGIYLPSDDRRHFVAWSPLDISDFDAAYWDRLYAWYEAGGYRNVAAYLAGLDLSGFNPKAPPPKTDAFWDIVDAGQAPEDAELADVLENRCNPPAITLGEIINHADAALAEWLRDRRNSRQIPHRMEAVGYVRVRNTATTDGRWKVAGQNQVIYARAELTEGARISAARALAESGRSSP